MIKKQYRRSQRGYFDNFIMTHHPDDSIDEQLKLYNATIAKSKNKHYKMNVKWYDEQLYTLFVLRYS